VLITTLESGGAADQGLLRAGDVIVAFAEQRVEGVDDLHRLLTDQRIGRDERMVVIRAGRLLILRVRPTADRG
jgi:S1-C subfamily serine protease